MVPLKASDIIERDLKNALDHYFNIIDIESVSLKKDEIYKQHANTSKDSCNNFICDELRAEPYRKFNSSDKSVAVKDMKAEVGIRRSSRPTGGEVKRPVRSEIRKQDNQERKKFVRSTKSLTAPNGIERIN